MTGPRQSAWTGAGQPADFYGHPDRACAVTDVDLFYSARETDQSLARRICKRCPFRQSCLEYALGNGEQHGVWGGVLMSSPDERAAAADQLGIDLAAIAPAEPEEPPAPAQRPDSRELEKQVRALWEQGKADGAIGLKVGINHGSVCNIRKRLGLPPNYGPGGQRINRQQVPA